MTGRGDGRPEAGNVSPRILVLTTVHHPDDTRIREKLIRSLAGLGTVFYATRHPGPTDGEGLVWIELPGGRMRRNLAALRLMLGRRFDLVVLHDPETIPAGVVARRLSRKMVVFDVHEDLLAQITSKEWIPVQARSIYRRAARFLYRLAERRLTLTLAEAGYRRLFRSEHPVFPNWPRASSYPDVAEAGDGSAVYVGDITVARGIEDAVAACRQAGIHLVLVGRVEGGLAAGVSSWADGVELTGPMPNPQAMRRVSTASVGLSPLRAEPNYMLSFPTKTLEYLAMGIPVVATDLRGTRDVIGELSAVWLVPAGDVTAMADAIREASSREAKELARDQAHEIRRRFRWPEDEVRSFYSGLLRRGEIPTPS